MRFRVRITCLVVAFCIAELALAAVSQKPKLVVAIIIDQFRYDYLTRFRGDLHGGLDHFLTHGADFTNAFYEQVPTVTAVGHSIFLSGAMPAVSGVIDNAWYDRDDELVVTSVCDWKERIVGAPTPEKKDSGCTDNDPASPRRLLVTTIGDELRTADARSKVIGISFKPRAAILPSGHRAAAAFWFDDATGHFVTSTYYTDRLPQWAEAFDNRKLPDTYLDKPWPNFPQWKFRPKSGAANLYSLLAAGPWGNELIEQFAEQAIDGEKLGARGVPDLLTVSFSSNDYVGHRTGPDSPEVRDMTLRTDELLARFFHFIDEKIGLANVVFVLSADHGVASAPTENQKTHIPGEYLTANPSATVSKALNARFGQAHWLDESRSEFAIYFDRKTLSEKKIPVADVFDVARQALFSDRSLYVSRVYDRTQLSNGITGDFVAQAVQNGFNPRRSGDLILVYEPGTVPGKSGTTHFSPYAYDRHVPVLIMGPGIKPGRYDETIAPNDIAPTLATLLNIQTPSGSSGRALSEILVH